jgi:uncharacterized membrane protein
MAATSYAHPESFWGSGIPKVWNASAQRRARVGNAVLVLFLLAQCFDGVFTYVGVVSFGLGVEANPLIASLMNSLGAATALASAKGVAAALGIALHLRGVHGAVALLTAFYLTVAIMPWMAILFPLTAGL